MVKHKSDQIVRSWVPLAAVTTIISLMIYAAVQQNYRQNANDPQIQLATDAAITLKAGGSPQSVLNSGSVNPAFSLSPFLITFDTSGNVTASGASLADTTPTPPKGVFSYAKAHGEDRFTWEPEAGVRIAAVVEYYSGTQSGYVLAGRSLGEIEQRENQLLEIIVVGWLAALVISAGLKVVF